MEEAASSFESVESSSMSDEDEVDGPLEKLLVPAQTFESHRKLLFPEIGKFNQILHTHTIANVELMTLKSVPGRECKSIRTST